MKLKLALLIATGSLAISTGAQAGDNWYGSIGAGANMPKGDNDFESPEGNTVNAFETDLDSEDAVAIAGAIGKYLGGGFRGELELSHRSNDAEGLNGDTSPGGFGGFDNINGNTTVQALMLNGFRDFGTSQSGVLNLFPYVGVGVGFARVRHEFDNLSSVPVSSADLSGPNGIVVGDTNIVPAIQGMVGVGIGFAENLMLDLRYKRLVTSDVKVGAFINDFGTLQDINSEYAADELMANLRWNFGGSAAPLAAAPVAAAVSYKDCWDGSRVVVTADCPPELVETVDAPQDLALTVYFDYDKSNLTDSAQSLISAKSEEAKQYDITAVTVQGNTDSAGSSAYNNALSARRGAVVRDALVANGIPADAISVSALGETNPAKPTADGAREPLNRRTDVKFDF